MGVKTLLALLAPLAAAAPHGPENRVQKRVTINTSVKSLGLTTSNFPYIYRDGGGGGNVNGLHLMIFSDGIYTDGSDPKNDLSNWRNFTANSIAVSAYQGAPVTTLFDIGTSDKGPRQQIPYYYNNGENDDKTGIWPNQNIATLCNGGCGVSFPEVVDRDKIRAGQPASLGNTAALITVGAFGPTVSRPAQIIFKPGEPLYGTFASYAGIDGYIYMLARITQTKSSNGLKLARVPWNSYTDRSQYGYWNGKEYSTTMPQYDDGGAANAFSWSTAPFGTGPWGPGTGDVFWSPIYGCYIMLFQSDGAALDNSVYMTYASVLTGPWSTPVSIYQMPTYSDGWDYGFHAYPNYDPSGRVIPISWTQYSQSSTYHIAMANITFS
ncbi:hypothetical protein GQ53DRAFT_859561 [Thozetella sp. PMI_491]|nr:hypothetical protein GQ53DRAFT_859561 [Thozetella sp. PMI_491]